MDKENKNGIAMLKDYWFMVVFIGMVIVSWTTFSNRLDIVEKRIELLEKEVDTLKTLQTDIAVIKEKIINIEKILK